MDLLMTDKSASQASDKIKDILFSKSAEKIQAIKPDVANSIFDSDVNLDEPEETETEAELDQDVDLDQDQESQTPEASAEEESEEDVDPQSAVAAGAVSMGRAV